MANPRPQLGRLVRRIRDHYPYFAYLHIVEPRVDGHTDRETTLIDHSIRRRGAWSHSSAPVGFNWELGQGQLRPARGPAGLFILRRLWVSHTIII